MTIRGNSGSKVAPYEMEDGSSFRGRAGIFHFTTTSRLALGPTQAPIQWELAGLLLGVKAATI